MSQLPLPYAKTRGSGFRFWQLRTEVTGTSYPFEIPIMAERFGPGCSGWLLVRIEIQILSKKKSVIGPAWKHCVTLRAIDRDSNRPALPIRAFTCEQDFPTKQEAMQNAIGTARATFEDLRIRGIRKETVDKYLSQYKGDQ